jgi:hypothetical protein
MRRSVRSTAFAFAAIAGFLATAAVAETRSMTVPDSPAASLGENPAPGAEAAGDPVAIAPPVEAVVAPKPVEQPMSLAVAAPSGSGLMGFLSRIVQSAGDNR